jgi:SAM-dependent methyltransferase
MNILTWYAQQFQSLDSVAQPNEPAIQAVLKKCLHWLPPQEFEDIIDVGAGVELITQRLGEFYSAVYAIDFQTPLERPLVPFNYHRVQGDAQFLAEYFPVERMDGLIINHSFEHFYSPYLFLCDAFCVLRPGGRIFLNLPEFDGPVKGPNYHHPSVLEQNYLSRMFMNIGFKILEMEIRSELYLDYYWILERIPLENIISPIRDVLERRMRLLL